MSTGASTESVSLRHHTSPPKTGSSVKKQEQNPLNCKEHIHQWLSTPPDFESPFSKPGFSTASNNLGQFTYLFAHIQTGANTNK